MAESKFEADMVKKTRSRREDGPIVKIYLMFPLRFWKHIDKRC